MFEDIKGVIKSSKSKMDRKHNGKKTKGQTMIYKVAHRKLKIEQNEPYKEPGVNSGVSEGQSNSCSTSGTSCVTLVTKSVIKQ